MWLVGVFSREWLWLVGGIYGCGYQEMGVVRMYIIIGMVINSYTSMFINPRRMRSMVIVVVWLCVWLCIIIVPLIW